MKCTPPDLSVYLTYETAAFAAAPEKELLILCTVDLFTPNLAAAFRRLSPAASASRKRSCSSGLIGGRPKRLPFASARLSPALTR
jgi:hypothetical protein